MPHPEHHTYLLSLWHEGGNWRAALRPAEGGSRVGFGNLEQLLGFLLRLQDDHLAAVANGGGPTEGGRDPYQADRRPEQNAISTSRASDRRRGRTSGRTAAASNQPRKERA